MRNQETTEFVVLGVLMNGSMHGYDINRFIRENLAGIWRISTSQLYALIHRLEEKGLVTGCTSSEGNQPPKKILSISPEGTTRFLEWVISPTQHVRDLRMEFLTKLFFLRYLKLQGGEELLEAQTALLTDLREKVEIDWGRQKDTFGKVVLGFKRSQFDVCLNWLNLEVTQFIGKILPSGTNKR
ncbi:MAG TPA: PadR family transcriptional regulator [Deltaproteobacteria bacterium]|nr:PadR family transcriptional regulator [Deltaproteobacteria bacterium]HPJ93692.1 PadR family transcriptional regulator [Deltaproteobacteria bacterium]HPR51454.1 PadR family transcriptional regulator [Deltaproteobacteria bacterium]